MCFHYIPLGSDSAFSSPHKTSREVEIKSKESLQFRPEEILPFLSSLLLQYLQEYVLTDSEVHKC